MDLVPGVLKVTSGIGIPIDGEEKVVAQADGEEKVWPQFGAEVTFLMDCSSSDLLAFTQYLRITTSI